MKETDRIIRRLRRADRVVYNDPVMRSTLAPNEDFWEFYLRDEWLGYVALNIALDEALARFGEDINGDVSVCNEEAALVAQALGLVSRKEAPA
jgi:hypothetical protein